jgi:hypothetical protein
LYWSNDNPALARAVPFSRRPLHVIPPFSSPSSLKKIRPASRFRFGRIDWPSTTVTACRSLLAMTSRTRPSFSMTLMRSTSISSNFGRVGDCARNAAAVRKTSASVLPPAYSFSRRISRRRRDDMTAPLIDCVEGSRRARRRW